VPSPRARESALAALLAALTSPLVAHADAPAPAAPKAEAAPPSTPPLAAPSPAATPPPSGRVLTLARALELAEKAQPSIRQAHAATSASSARVEQARAGYLPQVTATAGYQRTTGNFAPRPGATPATVQTPSPSFTTYNYFNFGLTASQLLYDFGQTNGRWRAAEASAEQTRQAERTTENQVRLQVEAAYYTARAEQALVSVARETLANQERHLAQIRGFVRAGTRPEIDEAQARTDVANARVGLIATENALAVAKTQLHQAMGVTGGLDFDVADEPARPVDGEEGDVEALVARAIAARPELATISWQREAQQRQIRAIEGAYGPALAASTSATAAGTEMGSLGPNWNIGVTLTWPLLQGGLTRGQVREAEAGLATIEAQADAVRLSVRTEVEQARLSVRSAKATIEAATDALAAARERLRLAEGRYATGVGSVIELGDAQLAAAAASAQLVQGELSLATARAQLATALGRR
jgi:outer membrane protein